MNHRVPSNRRYQPTEYEHAANCATHAVSPCPRPRAREDGAQISRHPLRNLKGHLKMSVFSPGAAAEGLGAAMRQMCPKRSWGAGRLSLLQLWEAGVHLPCSHPPRPRVPGEAGLGLSGRKFPDDGVFFTAGMVTGSPWGCLCSSEASAPHMRVSPGSWQLPLRALGDGSAVAILLVPSSPSVAPPGGAIWELQFGGIDPAWLVQVANIPLMGGSFDQK